VSLGSHGDGDDDDDDAVSVVPKIKSPPFTVIPVVLHVVKSLYRLTTRNSVLVLFLSSFLFTFLAFLLVYFFVFTFISLIFFVDHSVCRT
jgi:hypothetical protein